MLCAQGGAPDYSLSLWDWRAGVVVARATSPFTLTVHFSSFSQNNIVSCGKSIVNGNNLKKSYLKLVFMLSKTHILSRLQITTLGTVNLFYLIINKDCDELTDPIQVVTFLVKRC